MIFAVSSCFIILPYNILSTSFEKEEQWSDNFKRSPKFMFTTTYLRISIIMLNFDYLHLVNFDEKEVSQLSGRSYGHLVGILTSK